MNHLARVGAVIKTSSTPSSKASLRAMGIRTTVAGKHVSITQVGPAGISFSASVMTKAGSVDRELHLTLDHAENVFPSDRKNKKK